MSLKDNDDLNTSTLTSEVGSPTLMFDCWINSAIDIDRKKSEAMTISVQTQKTPDNSIHAAPAPILCDPLEEQRSMLFYELFLSYELGWEVASSGRPVTGQEGQPSDLWEMRINGDHRGEPVRAVFKVQFQQDAAIPVEVYALDLETGNEIGCQSE